MHVPHDILDHLTNREKTWGPSSRLNRLETIDLSQGGNGPMVQWSESKAVLECNSFAAFAYI